ncbi:hypothetical protein I6G55_21910 [Burkholderia oklahomensis]|nr:hypothetical protein [Burkholderia oklahomensis]MBI0362416.1 hypothetical protein [Burkholderia oklahomensis]
MSLRSSARATKGRAAVSATFGGGVRLARSNIGSKHAAGGRDDPRGVLYAGERAAHAREANGPGRTTAVTLFQRDLLLSAMNGRFAAVVARTAAVAMRRRLGDGSFAGENIRSRTLGSRVCAWSC